MGRTRTHESPLQPNLGFVEFYQFKAASQRRRSVGCVYDDGVPKEAGYGIHNSYPKVISKLIKPSPEQLPQTIQASSEVLHSSLRKVVQQLSDNCPRAERGPSVRPNLPNSIGPQMADVGRIGPIRCPFKAGADRVNVGQYFAQIDQVWSNLGQVWPNCGATWKMLVEVGPIAGSGGNSSTTVGQPFGKF